jgi:hypothetical protein
MRRCQHTDPVKIFAPWAAVALVAVALTGSPAASASGDLSGRWVSDSLRDNRIGYYLVLRPDPDRPRVYVGHLRFERQNGQRDARMPVTVTVWRKEAIITAREGRFDRAGRTISARFDGRGTLVLTNCLDRLRQVMSWDLASDCTLRQRG